MGQSEPVPLLTMTTANDQSRRLPSAKRIGIHGALLLAVMCLLFYTWSSSLNGPVPAHFDIVRHQLNHSSSTSTNLTTNLPTFAWEKSFSSSNNNNKTSSPTNNESPVSSSSSFNASQSGAVATTNSFVSSIYYDAFNTPAVRCRLGIEAWQNKNIDRWIQQQSYPLVEYVWHLTDQKTGQKYYLGLFNILRLGQSNFKRAKETVEWSWGWQDEYGNNYTDNTGIRTWRSGFKFARVYFRIDSGGLRPTRLWPILDNGTVPIVYDLKPYIRCNKVEQQHPPPSSTKIGACITRWWGQHDLMPEWIAYHRLLGVQHFWFFVAEPFDAIHNSTMPRQEPDITYIPYNYSYKDHRHLFQEELVYGGENWFQPSTNNQCLYLAKQYGLDWVLTPDVDEYVVIHDPNVTHFTSDPSPLQQVLKKYQADPDLGQVCLYGAGFGRHPTKHRNSTFELTIDFTYRKDRKYGNGEGTYDGKGAGGRKKCLYNVHLVTDVTAHTRVSGGTSITANASEMELYHFRTPLLGPQEATTEQLASYPQLRDQYRDKVKATLKEKQWTFPNFTAHVDEGYISLLN